MNFVLSLSSNQHNIQSSFLDNDFLIFSEDNEQNYSKNGFAKNTKKKAVIWK